MISPEGGTVRRTSASDMRDDPVLVELRRMTRLLAALTTRGLARAEAILFLKSSGFSSTQIGEILGVNPVTVRTTLHRGRKSSGAVEPPPSTVGPDTSPEE